MIIIPRIAEIVADNRDVETVNGESTTRSPVTFQNSIPAVNRVAGGTFNEF